MELFPQIMAGIIALAFGLIALGSIGEWLGSLGSSNKSLVLIFSSILVLSGCDKTYDDSKPPAELKQEEALAIAEPVVEFPENEVYINCRKSNYHGFEDYSSYLKFDTLNKTVNSGYLDFGAEDLEDLRRMVRDDSIELDGKLIWNSTQPFIEGRLDSKFWEAGEVSRDAYIWDHTSHFERQLDRSSLDVYLLKYRETRAENNSRYETYAHGRESVCSIVPNETALGQSIVENTRIFKSRFKSKLGTNKL
jgi:hypothetical protein